VKERPGLFDTTTIRRMVLPNRFVRSATWEGLAAPDGASTPVLNELSAALARGGVGLIISGHAFVSGEGRAGRWQLAADSDEMIPGLASMVAAVHAAGGAIALQIAHAGLRGIGATDGAPPGPSVLETDDGPVGREMDSRDLAAVTIAFAQAAARACSAGFDAVQIHAAHGYLLSQFLSPYFNRRPDAYGGSVKNRARLPVEVVEAVRQAVGPEFPILLKMNSEDFLPGGLTVDHMLETAALLREAGVDSLELSGGTFLSGDKRSMRSGSAAQEEPEAYYEAPAVRYKKEIGLPLMLVGGIRTYETAERLVAQGIADYVSLCRPLIREPGLVERWRAGDRRPSSCRSDNGCFAAGVKGGGIRCVVAPDPTPET
jgi:2,4-dienoyl-CoA reductase-like NADH-dependent reductase (Old Yellow Enzyme family)